MKINPTYKKILIAGVVLVTVLFCALYLRYAGEKRANLTEQTTLFIRDSTITMKELDSMLRDRLKNFNTFKKVAKRHNLEGSIKPGRYSFKSQSSNIEIVRALKFGWESPFNLTLSGNIRGIEKLAGILGKKMMYDSAAFSQYFNSPATWEKYGTDKENFASLFIPNTYQIYWSVTPEEFTQRMKKEYDTFWGGEREEKAKSIGLTKEEVSTLASIICEESNYLPDLPIIAGVYINRLKKGMKLDACPTIRFALSDYTIKRVLYKHLTVESPYNTYKYKGLPPGPITIPQIAGIDAVLNYQKHNYYYFCASEKLDGTHRFAQTHAQHNANARAYQRAISRLGIR